MRTPVCFIIFNRPDLAERVFNEIALARPPKLLVIADGPRPHKEGEAEKCVLTRAIINRVNWECEVLTNYSEVNLGCGRRVATGISWLFDQVEEAIILEDDCLPHPTFFGYCESLLEKYRNNPQIMHIGGSNFQYDRRQAPYSYFFSRFTPSWGWASWQRAWRHYDLEVKRWTEFRDTRLLHDWLRDAEAVKLLREIFDQCYSGVENVNTWDYQWNFACLVECGLAILPSNPLIWNLGFRADGTHTLGENDRKAKIPVRGMDFPLRHPPIIEPDLDAERIFVEEAILPGVRRNLNLYQKARGKVAAAMPQQFRSWLEFLRAMYRTNSL